MTETDPARSSSRLALIVIGTVVLLGLAVWAVSARGGGGHEGGTPGGPTGPNTSPSPVVTQPANAAIALTPSVGVESRNVLVRGSGFGADEEVVLSVDGKEAKRIRTDASGGFTAGLTVSFSRSSFVVRAVGGTSNATASGTVTF